MAQHPLHHGIIWKRADLNRQALQWCDVVANARVHGTTHRVPWEMLETRPKSQLVGFITAPERRNTVVNDVFVHATRFNHP